MSDLNQLWAAITSIRSSVDDHSIRLKVCEARQEDFSHKHNDLCLQLKETDTKISAKIDFLIAEYHKSQGAKLAANWLPTIISAVVGIIAIYTFISK